MSKAQGQFTIIDYNDALTLTGYTPVRVYRAWMSKPWILELAFNDSDYGTIDLRRLAEKLPKVVEHLEYFKEARIVPTDDYGYELTFDCGLRLTAAECYEFWKR